MAEPTRLEKVAEIERINRVLGRAIAETRDASGRFVKRDLTSLYRRRDELLAETGGGDTSDPGAAAQVRQIRMIGRKGL